MNELNNELFPEEITQQIICSQCGSTLEITIWEDYELPPPFPLHCPICGLAVALGNSIIVIEAKPWPPEEEPPEEEPSEEIIDWLKKNWKWIATWGIGLGIIIVLARRS